VLKRRGYREGWRNSIIRVDDPAQLRVPPHRTEELRGDYLSEASRLRYLNHREAAGYRWGCLWDPVKRPTKSDFPAWVEFRGVRVRFPGGDAGLCVVTTGLWRPSGLAVADLLVPMARRHDAGLTRKLVSVAAGLGRELGANSLEACLPADLAPQVLGEGIQRGWLWNGDPWYVKDIRKARPVHTGELSA
jgi:hypothetical protein